MFHSYDLLRGLDAGGMAEAYVARNRETGQRVFLKRVRRKSADKDALEREMRIYDKLMRMSLTHVIQILDFVRDDEYFALVTEFADGGDLQSHVESQNLILRTWDEAANALDAWVFQEVAKFTH